MLTCYSARMTLHILFFPPLNRIEQEIKDKKGDTKKEKEEKKIVPKRQSQISSLSSLHFVKASLTDCSLTMILFTVKKFRF